MHPVGNLAITVFRELRLDLLEVRLDCPRIVQNLTAARRVQQELPKKEANSEYPVS